MQQLLQSKKFLASALASVISFLGIRQGMTYDQIAMVIGPLLVYVGGQSLADVGKSRAQIEAVFKPNKPGVSVTTNVAPPAQPQQPPQ